MPRNATAIYCHVTMDGRFVCIWALLLGAWSVTTVVGGAISRRSAPTPPLIVRRGYHTPDLFTIDANNACAVSSDDCLKLFNATTFKSEKNATTVASCQCQCPTNRPVYLPSRRQCVASLDECRRPIPFEVGAEHQAERWAPTFFLPLQSNVFAVENRIKWTDGGVRVAANGSVNCSVDDVGLLTDTGWMSFADRHLFRLTEANGAAYLLWMGGQAEQVELRGGLVQVTLRCDASAEAEHCVAFRVYGVNGDEDDDSANGMLASSKKGDRLELIVAILCGVLLFLTVLGSVIMWNLCWRYHKDRLSRKIHMQVMYQQRVQQGIYQTNQPPFPYPPAPGQHPFTPMGDCMVPSQLEIHRQMEAEANASRAQWSGSIDFPDAQGPASPSAAPNTGALLSNAEQQQLRIQPPPPYPQNAKRKLFFSPEFFEPELMQDPPQLAEEFLYEVRRMIDMAKNRIRLRRHMPNLFAIPEEGGEGRASSKASTNSEPPAAHDHEDVIDPMSSSVTMEDLAEMTFICREAAEASPKSGKSTDSGRASPSSRSPLNSSPTQEPRNSGDSGIVDDRYPQRPIDPAIKVNRWLNGLRSDKQPPLASAHSPSTSGGSGAKPAGNVDASSSNNAASAPDAAHSGQDANGGSGEPTSPIVSRALGRYGQTNGTAKPPQPTFPRRDPWPYRGTNATGNKPYTVFPSELPFKKSLPRSPHGRPKLHLSSNESSSRSPEFGF